MTVHASDCAVHNGPATKLGMCDCGASALAAEMENQEMAMREAMVQREDRAEKMAAYRMHANELGVAGMGGSAIGYVGTMKKTFENQNRERALQIAWDLYRDKGDHELVLRAAKQIADFLNCAEVAA